MKSIRQSALSFGLIAGLLGAGLWPQSSLAMNRDLRAVLRATGWGAAGGTVLGLATFPFAKNVPSIFLGTAVGAVLGLGVGVYYITNREDFDEAVRRSRQSRWEGVPARDGSWEAGRLTLARQRSTVGAEFRLLEF